MNTTTQAKVFCIGLSKTATTSLAAALTQLGYKVRDNIGVTRYTAGDISCIDEHELKSHDAFTDTPIPSFYKQLDAKYPGSKFILTSRELKAWLLSCKKQFTQKHADARSDAVNQLFLDLYDSTCFDEEKFTHGYNRFVADAKDYFKDRPSDFLVIDLCEGEGWDKLCQFLGKHIPDIPVPVTNVTKIQWLKVEDIVAIAREAGKKLPQPPQISNTTPSTPAVGILGRISNKIQAAKSQRQRKNIQKSKNAAHKIIVDGLTRLNPTIPILSVEGQNEPYSERKGWSHLWLIDIHSGAEAYLNHGTPLTVSIALIENGSPRTGVVYIPKKDTVYYTKNTAVSFKQVGHSEPIELHADNDQDQDQRLPVISSAGNIPSDVLACHNNTDNTTTQRQQATALALCAVAEGAAKAYIGTESAKEWEVAAAHAIINGAGKKLINHLTGETPRYNGEHLAVEPILAK